MHSAIMSLTTFDIQSWDDCNGRGKCGSDLRRTQKEGKGKMKVEEEYRDNRS